MRATDEQYREAAYAKLEGIEHVEVEKGAKVDFPRRGEPRGRWVTVQVWVTHEEAAKVTP